jgi:hypothetical protein
MKLHLKIVCLFVLGFVNSDSRHVERSLIANKASRTIEFFRPWVYGVNRCIANNDSSSKVFRFLLHGQSFNGVAFKI